MAKLGLTQKMLAGFSAILLGGLLSLLAQDKIQIVPIPRDQWTNTRPQGSSQPVVAETRIQPQTIQDVRPLLKIADRMQRVYGRVVTYEDPLLISAADNEPADERVKTLSFQLTPLKRAFRFPLDTADTPDINGALTRVLAAYHNDSGGPRFRIATSALGSHLIPTEVRDATGQWIPAQNPLDKLVLISNEKRKIGAHIKAIGAAVSAATGFPYNSIFTWDSMGSILPDGYGEAYEWGTTGPVPAREALIDLLNEFDTTLTWNSTCSEAYGKSEWTCFLFISHLEIATTQLDGTVVSRPLLHDRCPKCTPGQPAKPPQ